MDRMEQVPYHRPATQGCTGPRKCGLTVLQHGLVGRSSSSFLEELQATRLENSLKSGIFLSMFALVDYVGMFGGFLCVFWPWSFFFFFEQKNLFPYFWVKTVVISLSCRHVAFHMYLWETTSCTFYLFSHCCVDFGVMWLECGDQTDILLTVPEGSFPGLDLNTYVQFLLGMWHKPFVLVFSHVNWSDRWELGTSQEYGLVPSAGLDSISCIYCYKHRLQADHGWFVLTSHNSQMMWGISPTYC